MEEIRIIGRYKERDELEGIMTSGKSEFVVMYGRRRVGKTFLIKQHYRGRFTFYSTGLADARLRDQLTSFNGMMRANKHYDQNQVVAKNWMEAFQ